MQNADAKSSVRVLMMSPLLFVRNAMRVSMQMQVAVAIVFVFVGVYMKGFAHGPGANTYEHQAHHPFAPLGKQIRWEHVSEPKRQESNYPHAGRMS